MASASALQIHAMSVDSRSRKPSECISSYEVRTDTMSNVRSVQLGSIQLPDSRYAFNEGDAVCYSEPIQIPASSTLQIIEKSTARTKATGAVLPTNHGTVTLTPPSTLNLITTYSTPTITTTTAHGLAFAHANAPTHLQPIIIAANYPNTIDNGVLGAPEANSTNATVATATTFTMTDAYLITKGGAGPVTVAGAYLYSPPPTLTELLEQLNSQLATLYNPTNLSPAGAALMLNHAFVLDDANNCIRLHAPQRVIETPTTITTITSTLQVAGTLAGLLGFSGSSALSIGQGACSDLATLPLVHCARITPGNYTADEMVTHLNRILCPLDFNDTTAANRTVTILEPGGLTAAAVIIQGRYTGPTLATQLAFQIDAVVAATDNSYTVTYVQEANGGRFTIALTGGEPFGIDFSIAAAANTASLLGFDPIVYHGATSYTSPHLAVVGVTTNSPAWPVNCLNVSQDSKNNHFKLYSTVALKGSVTPTSSTNMSWPTVVHMDSMRAGQSILYVQNSNNGDLYTVVVDTVWAGGDAAPTTVILTTPSSTAIEALNGGTGYLVSLSDARRNAFQLHFTSKVGTGSVDRQLGFTPQTQPPTRIVGQLPICTDAGPTATYPSYFSAPASTTTALSTPMCYESPCCWALEAWPYIMMVLEEPCASDSASHAHYMGSMGVQERTPILAKFLIRSTYVHVSEEMLHGLMGSSKKIDRLKVKFINPDGTLVNFNGRQHTFTLLFTLEADGAVGYCR